jgi:hypothetical protein
MRRPHFGRRVRSYSTDPGPPAHPPLIRVELIQADKTDIGALAGSQFAVEAGAAVAGEYRVLGVESLDREQVPGPPQPLDVAQVHNPVPLHLAEGKHLAWPPVLGGTSIWIWVRLAGSETTPDPTSPGGPPKTAGSAAAA